MIALRIAGPLPAECTPLRVGGNPSHNLRMARSVAKPIPGGIPSSQSRSFHARQRWKAIGSFGCASSACATKSVCSVSSLNAHEYFCNALRLEPLAQAGGPAMAVVEQAAVAVYVGVCSFGKYLGDALAVQRSGEFRTCGVLQAVHRPQRLRQTVQFNCL